MTRTAATAKPGDLLEFYAIPILTTRVLTSGPYAGMIHVTYARSYDDSRNDWRVYPADYLARY